MTLSDMLYAGCAVLYTGLAGFALFGARLGRTDALLALGCLVTASWAGVEAYYGVSTSGLVGALELGKSVAWYGLVLHLYHRSVLGGSHVRRIFSGIGALTIVVTILSFANAGTSVGQVGSGVSFASIGLDARLGLGICTILLIENLYRNAPADLRWHVALPCIALGGICIYDILLYGDAVLFRRLSPMLSNGRAVATILIAPLLATSVGRNRRRWGAIQVSRTAVFHTASLVVIGIFLLALAATGEILRQLGSDQQSDWGKVLEVGLVCGGVLTAGVFLTSGSARSVLRSLVVDNFFAQRYDYRVEWLRCLGTLSQQGGASALHSRVIRTIAQIVDSPAGTLFLREPGGSVFRWAGSWNMPPAMANIAADASLPSLFRGGHWVVEAAGGPAWIEGMPDLWLAVPLSHAGRLIGFTLVSRPRSLFTLDREVFDLLRIVGQEGASHVAEQQAAESLLQTRQLREYGERFAFVAHDIKNVASQLSLLLANAEHHISNPEFQKDMLKTVEGSVEKITSLLARLKTPQEDPTPSPLVAVERVKAVTAARAPNQRARIHLDYTAEASRTDGAEDPNSLMRSRVEDAAVRIVPGHFDAVLAHLLDNAFEASAFEAPVVIRLRLAGQWINIEIIDHGSGMSAEFIRDRLFQPFNSSKSDGFGLGVYQARELLRQAGGDLLVTSSPGSGTIMRLSLPAALPAIQQQAPESAR